MKKCRFIAGFLTFVMAIAVFASPLAEYLPIQGNSLTASAASISSSEIQNKIEKMAAGNYGNEYKAGQKFPGSFTGAFTVTENGVKKIHWNSRSSQCMGFAKKAFEKIFEGYGTTAQQITYNGNYSDTNAMANWVKENARPGDYMRWGDGGVHASNGYGHSVIIHSVTSSGLKVYDANGGKLALTTSNVIQLRDMAWGSNTQAFSFKYKALGTNKGGLYLIRHNAVISGPTPEPSSRFSVSIDKITDNNAIINFVAYKKTTESTKSFSIKVWETNNSSNSKSFSFNSSYPNVGKTQNTGLSFDLKNEVKFSMKHATKYSFTITSNYTENGANRSYTSSTYSFTTTGSHSYGSWTTSKAATCTASGTETRKCSCGATETRTIAAKGHKYAASYTIDKYATCTSSGSKSRHCTVCGAKTDVTTIPATGHDFWGWVTTQEPTCTESGVQTRYCGYCSATETRKTDPLGHNFNETVVVPPTSYSEGYTKHTCSRCGSWYTDNYTDVLSVERVSDFSLTDRASSSLTFSWNKVYGATGYMIQIYKNGKWIGYNISDSDMTSYTVSGLSAGTKYKVRICAVIVTDTETVSGAYNEISAITSPSNMSGFKLHTRGIGALKFSWSRNTSATGYQLQIYKGGKWVTYNIKSGGTTAYVISGLSAGTKYNVRIRPMKTIDGTTVFGSYKMITAITAPSNMSGFKLHTRGIGALKFSWSRNTSATGYQLQIYKGGKWVTYNIKSGSTTAYVISGLSAGTKYNVRIRPMKTIGGTTVFGSYKMITAITAPSNMSGFKLHTRGIGALKFSWSRNTSATGYQLQIYKSGKWVTYNIKSGATTAYTISGLSAGTRYNVRIRPMKTISGTTVYGSYKTITAITAPSNMSGFKLAAQGRNSLKIGWSKNASATGYQLQIYKGGKWVTYTISGNTKTSYTVKSLSAGTKYKFRIRAYKKIGTSTVYGNFSATKTFSTKK